MGAEESESKKIYSLLKDGREKQAVDAIRTLLTRPSNLPEKEVKNLLRLGGEIETSVNNLNNALSFYYELLKLSPSDLSVREQIRSIHRQLVPSWHFEMMNDVHRNEAFHRAIQNAVTPESLVFEIGTGSGLLAMMAAQAGAKKVVTCERLLPLAKVSEQIVELNGLQGQVEVLRKSSEKIEVGTDLPEKADVLIAEILGPAILEEGVLRYLEDARARLLKAEAKVLPLRAELYAFLLQCEPVFHGARVHSALDFDLSRFNSLFDEPLMEHQLSRLPHSALSADQHVTTVHFDRAHSPVEEKELSFSISTAGSCHGIAQWFRLFVDEENIVETGPKAEASHWRQMIQVFDRPLEVQAGQTLLVNVRERENRFSFQPTNLIS